MADRLVEAMQSLECRPLLERLRMKLERGDTLTGTCRLSGLTPSQRRRIGELTGTDSRGKIVVINLALFSDIVCNTGRFESLRELTELACGHTIHNQRVQADDRASAWSDVWKFSSDQIPPGETGLDDVLTSIRKTGWLTRVTGRDPQSAKLLLTQAFALLKRLPTSPTPLAIFAAENAGDAHALDSSQTLGQLLLKLLSPAQPTEHGMSETQTARRRRIWETVGIVTDELSSSALVLNLPATGESLTDLTLRSHLDAGMPCRLTFRHLRLSTPKFSSGSHKARPVLYVCENPSVLAAAAEQLGPRCPPIICVEGQPTLACWYLLEILNESGYQLNYHGDFDGGGIRIANQIYERLGFEPWRFTASDHRIISNTHRKLRPPITEAIWDSELAEKIRSCGVAVEEESVINDLLGDLDRSSLFTP